MRKQHFGRAADGREGRMTAVERTAAEEAAAELAATPEGRVFTEHYLTDTGPKRLIPGSA